MQEFSYPLGDAIKRARGELWLTQSQVAEKSGIDARTVMNIENYKGNPKMEVLYPLVRALKLDSREIFNPEMKGKALQSASFDLWLRNAANKSLPPLSQSLNPFYLY